MERPVYHIPGAVKDKAENRDFVGPLDLILYLLRKDKIAIRDISLADILQQYLDWMEARERLDLEVAGEFIAMASQLMYLKTKMLLAEEDKEALSEMEELIASLEARERRASFQRLEVVLPQLAEAFQQGRDSFSKGAEARFAQRVYRYEHSPSDLTAAVLAWQARQAAAKPPDGRLLRRTVRPEPYRVEEKARQLLDVLEQQGPTSLTALVARSGSRSEATAVFLALLELCRGGKVHLAGTMEDPSISLRGEEEAILGRGGHPLCPGGAGPYGQAGPGPGLYPGSGGSGLPRPGRYVPARGPGHPPGALGGELAAGFRPGLGGDHPGPVGAQAAGQALPGGLGDLGCGGLFPAGDPGIHRPSPGGGLFPLPVPAAGPGAGRALRHPGRPRAAHPLPDHAGIPPGFWLGELRGTAPAAGGEPPRGEGR